LALDADAPIQGRIRVPIVSTKVQNGGLPLTGEYYCTVPSLGQTVESVAAAFSVKTFDISPFDLTLNPVATPVVRVKSGVSVAFGV